MELLMDRLLAIVLAVLAPSSLLATDYYVRTDGDDGNDGLTDSAGGAWAHIWYAANNVSAGDTVHIGSGTFNEFVTNTVSGSAGNQITFSGTRSGTNWLTIIDPSTSASNGWSAAAELGSGVYKKTDMPFWVSEMTIGGKRVAFPNTTNTITGITGAYSSSPTNGSGFLTLASGGNVTFTDTGNTVAWWDTIGALYATVSSSITYLRIRDGSDPNGLTIRVAPNQNNGTTTDDVNRPAIYCNQSYITWENLKIRGAFSGILLTGAGASNNVVQSNYLANGYARIAVRSGANNNTFRFNELTTDFYGADSILPGAWAYAAGAEDKENFYRWAKNGMSPDATSFDEQINLFVDGGTNTIYGNSIHDGMAQGVSLWNNAGISYGNQVYSNSFERHSSVGMILSEGESNVRVFGNYYGDNNINLRLHKFNSTNSVTSSNRTLYVYRNRSWLPDGLADHIFINFEDSYTVPSFHPTTYIYHNSISGGARGIDYGSTPTYGTTNMFILNNIFSDCRNMYDSVGFRANTNGVAMYDYNLLADSLVNGAVWMGNHNITNASPEWVNTEGMSFAIAADSDARGAALVTTNTWVSYNNTFYRTNAALPDSFVLTDATPDLGALEYIPPYVNTNRVQYTEDLWIK